MRFIACLALITSVAAACTLRGADYLTEGRGGAGGGKLSVGGAGGSTSSVGGGGDGGSCSGTMCGDACVDLQTDESHCGECGNECPSPTCRQGACLIYEDTATGAYIGGVDSDVTYLFFGGTVGGTTGLHRIPLGTIDDETIIELPDQFLTDLVVTDDSYLAQFEGSPPAVVVAQKDDVLVNLPPPFTSQRAARIASRGLDACWNVENGAQCRSAGTNFPNAIDIGQTAHGVAVAVGSVYVTGSNADFAATPQLPATAVAVHAASVDGLTAPETIVSMAGTAIGGILQEAGKLLFTTDQGLWRVDPDGQNLTLLGPANLVVPWEVVATGGLIYFADRNPGRVFRVPDAGGTPELVFDAPNAQVSALEDRDGTIYIATLAPNLGRIYARPVFAAGP